MKLESLLAAAKQHNASDLHLIFGVPPAYRINGEIILADEDAMSAE
jgi:twitching motility protein PilT